MKEDIIEFTLVLAILGAIMLGALLWNSWSCDNQWPNMEHRWVIPAGCQVHTPEGWIPASNYRVID